MGGVGRHVTRSLARGITYAAVGTAISSWTRDSYYNKDENGNTESMALPVIAISQVTQSGNKLIVELKSGGDMQFHFKQKKVITSIIANITSAQDAGKCPYCGTNAGNVASCPKCGGVIEGGGGSGAASGGGGVESVTIQTGGGSGAAGYCHNCGKAYPAGARFCGGCGQQV